MLINQAALLFPGWIIDSCTVSILHVIQCTSGTLVHINGVLHWLFSNGHHRFSSSGDSSLLWM